MTTEFDAFQAKMEELGLTLQMLQSYITTLRTDAPAPPEPAPLPSDGMTKGELIEATSTLANIISSAKGLVPVDARPVEVTVEVLPARGQP